MRLSKIFSKISGLSVILVIFLLPVYFSIWPKTYNVFEMAKFSLFKVLALLLIISFSAWMISDGGLRQRAYAWFRKYYSWLIPPFIFCLYATAAAWLSGDFKLIFFGSYLRQDGAISLWALFIWFIFLTLYLSLSGIKDFFARKAVPAMLLSATAVSLYGICQFFGADIVHWAETPLLSRIFSSFGQPNFLAAFLLLSLPLSVYFSYRNIGMMRILSSFSVLIQLSALFFTSSRAAMIGLFAGILLFAWTKGKAVIKKFGKKGLFAIFAVLILSAGVFVLINPGRFDIESFKNGSASSRIEFYKSGMFAFMDRPIIGYGMAGINKALFPFYDIDWGLSEKINTVPDRTHNVIIDFSLSFGLIGWALLLFWLWRWKKMYGKDAKGEDDNVIAIALVSYLVSLMFGFITVVNFILIWFFAAYLISKKTSIPGSAESKPSSHWPIVAIAVLAVAGLLFEVQVWRADHVMNNIYIASTVHNQEKMDEDYSRLLKIHTYPSFSDYYRFLYVQMSLENMASNKGDGDLSMLKEAALSLPEDSFNYILVKAMAMSHFSDEEGLSDKLFLQSQAFSTHMPLAYYRYGKYLLDKGEYKPAIMQLYMAQINSPSLDDGFSGDHRRDVEIFLAGVYSDMGKAYVSESKLEVARDYFKKSLSLNDNQPDVIKGIADTYFLSGDMDNASSYIHWGMTRFPGDPAWPIALEVIENNK